MEGGDAGKCMRTAERDMAALSVSVTETIVHRGERSRLRQLTKKKKTPCEIQVDFGKGASDTGD